MAGLGGFSPTPGIGTIAAGQPPGSVSWASRTANPTGAKWTTPGTMTPEQAQMYGQADINRGMMEGQQSYQSALMQAQRGWQLEDQRTALDLFGSAAGAGGGTPARVSGDDSAWSAMLAGQMGQAKDNAAAAVGAARKALGANMTARGIGGSGIEGKNERAIQLAGAGQIGAAGRDAAALTANRQAAVSDRNYSGDITQRGQDITAQGQKLSLMPSIFSLLRAGVSY
jgi:hypothetical protein